jgi:hypothetical protein
MRRFKIQQGERSKTEIKSTVNVRTVELNQQQVPRDMIDTDRSAWTNTDRQSWTEFYCTIATVRTVFRDRGDRRCEKLRAKFVSRQAPEIWEAARFDMDNVGGVEHVLVVLDIGLEKWSSL